MSIFTTRRNAKCIYDKQQLRVNKLAAKLNFISVLRNLLQLIVQSIAVAIYKTYTNASCPSVEPKTRSKYENSCSIECGSKASIYISDR